MPLRGILAAACNASLGPSNQLPCAFDVLGMLDILYRLHAWMLYHMQELEVALQSLTLQTMSQVEPMVKRQAPTQLLERPPQQLRQRPAKQLLSQLLRGMTG